MKNTIRCLTILCLAYAQLALGDTLMLEVNVDANGAHQLQRSWIESRSIPERKTIGLSENALLVEAYDETAQVIESYSIEDSWHRISHLHAKERVDMQAPESYLIRLSNPRFVDKVVVSRVTQDQSAEDPETLIVIDSQW